jgi:hypothetical protein
VSPRACPRLLIACLMGLLLAPLASAGQEAADTIQDEQERPPALTHVLHVSETFRGTPDGMGLLPTALAEAEIARRHATLAAQDPSDLDAMKRHVGHVLHALDPSAVESGPGLGYGAVRAAERTAHYISLAAASVGATPPIQTHAEHIATAARNAATNGTAAAELAQEILESEDAASAAELLEEMTARVTAMADGVDANGDGTIGWQEGEGGLAQAQTHLELLRRAAGLEGS